MDAADIETLDQTIDRTIDDVRDQRRREPRQRGGARPASGWTFLTNHAHVLLAIARTPDLRIREIAGLVGVTERTAMQIVVDLERDGYVRRERHGRRNHYTVDEGLHLRHPLEGHHRISHLLDALGHRPSRSVQGD